MAEGECSSCGYGPCRVPSWARDGSFYSNNPGKFEAAVSHAHSWFERPWLKGIEQARADALTLVRPPSYPCSACGKHAFPDPGTICFWCQRLPLRVDLG